MATGTATYSPQAGYSYVTLAGTVKTDSLFATQPVAGDQIVFPDTISISSDLTVVGAPGNYDVWHIVSSTGQAVYTKYGIAGGGSLTYNPPSGHSVVTLSGNVASNNYFPVQPVAGDQIVYPDALTVTAQLIISGTTGNYTLWHIVASTGVVYNVSYFIGDGVAAGSISYTAGSEYTTATLADGYDTYIFEQWQVLPKVGEQITTRTSDGYFTDNGDYITNLEHEHDAWHTALDGTITHFLVDSRMQQGDDITPDVPVFTALTNQPVDTLIESNAITVSGIDVGFDIPVSASAGASYAVLQSGGSTWSAFTTTPGFVQLGDQVKLRQRSSINNGTQTTATLTLNNVSASWSVTTNEGLIESPTQFSFTPVDGVELSTEVESSPITVLGLTFGVNAQISISGGEYAVSVDNGDSYSAYTTAQGTVKLGDRVKVKGTSSSQFLSTQSIPLTIGGVSASFSITTRAQDTDPNGMSFPSKSGQVASTLVESNGIEVVGIDAGVDAAISITGGSYAISTDGGQSYGDWTTSPGVVQLGNFVKVQVTTGSDPESSVTAVLRIGDTYIPFTATTAKEVFITIPDGAINTPAIRTMIVATRRSTTPKVHKQDAVDNVDYAVDFSMWLGDDTITEALVVENASLVSASAKTTTKVSVFLTNGTLNDADRISLRVTTAAGRQIDYSFYVVFIDY